MISEITLKFDLLKYKQKNNNNINTLSKAKILLNNTQNKES